MKAIQSVFTYVLHLPKTFHTLLKISVSLLAIIYVFYKIKQDPQGFDFFLRPFSIQDGIFLLLSFSFIFANISLEALKWQKMMKMFYPNLHFSTSLKAVLAGNTAGIFTPNRVGEYAARVMYLPSGKRVEALTLTLIDKVCQMLITMWTGMFAVSYFLHYFQTKLTQYLSLSFGSLQKIEISAWSVVVLSSLTLIFAKKWVVFLPKKWLTWEIFAKMKTAICQVPIPLLLYILLLSTLRNLVFTLQYYLLLMAFGYEGETLLAFAMVSSVFLLKSVVPSISFSELGIRESVALTVMGAFAVASSTTISSTFLLYLYNIALPALVGILFLNKQS
ncbi:MAG: lysylphosphatidylglycerol synthase domain-containing protein [Bacteroidia bacterium]